MQRLRRSIVENEVGIQAFEKPIKSWIVLCVCLRVRMQECSVYMYALLQKTLIQMIAFQKDGQHPNIHPWSQIITEILFQEIQIELFQWNVIRKRNESTIVNIYAHFLLRAHKHTHTHTHTHKHKHTDTHVYKHIYIHTHTLSLTYTHTYTFIIYLLRYAQICIN